MDHFLETSNGGRGQVHLREDPAILPHTLPQSQRTEVTNLQELWGHVISDFPFLATLQKVIN